MVSTSGKFRENMQNSSQNVFWDCVLIPRCGYGFFTCFTFTGDDQVNVKARDGSEELSSEAIGTAWFLTRLECDSLGWRCRQDLGCLWYPEVDSRECRGFSLQPASAIFSTTLAVPWQSLSMSPLSVVTRLWDRDTCTEGVSSSCA